MEERGGVAVRMADIAKAAGVSRQAVYLHFPARADLLIETTRHMDRVMDVDARLEAFRSAKTGAERLDAFIAFIGGHWPQVSGVARALMNMRETDKAAAEAWTDRMSAVKEGCHASIEALARDGRLVARWSIATATDLLWTMLSYPNWYQLTTECGWTQVEYCERMQKAARQAFVAG